MITRESSRRGRGAPAGKEEEEVEEEVEEVEGKGEESTCWVSQRVFNHLEPSGGQT